MKKQMLKLILGITVLFFTASCNDGNDASKIEYVHVGPNWEAVHNLPASTKSFKVTVKAKPTVKEGSAFKFQVQSEKKGRLWIVQVDSKDQVTLLFPNEADKNNTIEKDSWVSIPSDNTDYQIVAGKPYGKSTIAVVVTIGNTDLSDVLGAKKSLSKALVLLEKEPAWGLCHIVVDVSS